MPDMRALQTRESFRDDRRLQEAKFDIESTFSSNLYFRSTSRTYADNEKIARPTRMAYDYKRRAINGTAGEDSSNFT